MSEFTRYAVYYLPEGCDFVPRAAAWLGWDSVAGRAVPQPALDGLPRPPADLTETPRRYGLHATLKPPFRLAEGASCAALDAAVSDLAHGLAPVEAPALVLSRLGHFLALTPSGDQRAISALAAATVRALDGFRAPPAPDELHRRRTSGLSAAQEANLGRWGYPYVLEEFRFHITLTGRLRPGEFAAVEAALARYLGPLPAPFRLDRIALAGEDGAGRFHLIRSHALTG